MKRLYTAIAVLALTLTVGVTAMAQGKMSGKGGQKAGCSSCNSCGVNPEQVKKFKADTIDLRQEMMNKRFDLQRENLKETPDAAKVAAIKSEIETIKGKLESARKAAGISEATCGKMNCFMMDENCDNCMKSGNSCNKKANSAKQCNNCDKKSDCGCKNCNKGECKNCPDSANCNCAKKTKK